MIGVSVRDEWSQLRRLLLGRADSLNLPAEAFRDSHGDGLDRLELAAANRMTRTRCGFEQGRLIHQLRRHGVEVETAGSLPPEMAASVPGQLFVRDLALLVGDRSWPAFGLREDRGREQTALMEWIEDGALPPLPADACLEGGDLLLDGDKVYVGLGGQRSNAAGLNWLEQVLNGGAQVVAVPFMTLRRAHLDFCMALVGPGRGVIHRPAFPDGLPAPLDDYDWIEVGAETFAQLGVNLLMLNPAMAVVQSRHQALREALAAWGIDSVGLDFSQHLALGGGFRCASLALKREPSDP